LIKENEMNSESLERIFYRKIKIETIIVSPLLKNKEEFTKLIYSLPRNIKIVDFRNFFETVYRKEPLELLDDVWFIENLRYYPFFSIFKRVFDVLLAFILLTISSPIILICIFFIIIFSPGSIFFKQKVFGQNNKNFILYKLRTMREGSEYPLWTTPGDGRVTKVGRILRTSHLDELPQLYNILRGDLSFVGPRPERIELAKIFEEKLLYYNVRRLVKPGLTGWAQINYKPSASIEEALEKLKYDFYYLKNRSFLLDLFIILKTAKLLIISPK
jgi:lipopolysaccharide/colanic/teichoic acid biosynthesis glycosyltransferase